MEAVREFLDSVKLIDVAQAKDVVVLEHSATVEEALKVCVVCARAAAAGAAAA